MSPILSLVTPPQSLPLQLLIVGGWLGGVIGCAEALKRLVNLDPEITRKVVHIGAGNVILWAWWFQLPTWMGLAASVLFGVLTLVSYRYPILASVSEVGRRSLGTFFYAVSIGVLTGWFWPLHIPQYAAIGILVMTWGDGLAALIGQRWGRHPYTAWGIRKSWEGSLTMVGVSGLVTSLVLLVAQGNSWQTWVSAIAIAIVATGLEAFSKFGIDNLTVPLASGALCFFLNEFWL